MKIQEHQIPSLIQQGKAKEAVSDLYKYVFPNVKKYILANNGSKDDALDAFQEALMRLYTLVMENRFNSEKYKVYGFVYRISIYHWIDKLRKDKRMIFQEEMKEYGIEEPLETAVKPEEENYIRSLFSSIGEKCIELLTCTVFYDMLMEDVAIRMGFASVAAARMQQQRCKQKLMEEMARNPHLLDKIKGI
jgi:RNA polymerase sigma factor (sigma-70 family)